jgi:methyl-accepting chemotaxis protein
MQLTKERPAAPQRVGLLRRIILGEDGGSLAGFRDRPADFIDLRTTPALDEANERIERLEIGMRLMAETMKRTYGHLASAMTELSGQAVVGTTIQDVQNVVAEALEPVAAALGEVAETMRTFPYLVAAAAEHVTERVDEAREVADAESHPTSTAPEPDIAVLPVVPFEMEPLEEAFDPLTALRRGRFGMEEL